MFSLSFVGGSKSAEGGSNLVGSKSTGTPASSRRQKDIDDFTICPTHISNLGTDVEWSCGSISRCRVPKEVYGRGKGTVTSIPTVYWGIGRRVPQIVLK